MCLPVLPRRSVSKHDRFHSMWRCLERWSKRHDDCANAVASTKVANAHAMASDCSSSTMHPEEPKGTTRGCWAAGDEDHRGSMMMERWWMSRLLLKGTAQSVDSGQVQ